MLPDALEKIARELENHNKRLSHLERLEDAINYTEGARVYNSLAISIPTGVFTVLTFDSEYYDTDNIHSIVLNTSRLTCRTAGKYVMVAHFTWQASALGARRVGIIFHNGLNIIGYDEKFGGNAALVPGMVVVTIDDLAVNDFIETYAFQDTGGNIIVGAAAQYTPVFMMQRIG